MRERILTDRLLIRDVTEDDAQFMRELDADAEVMRYIGQQPTPDLASYLHRLRTVYLPAQVHPWHGIRIVADRTTGELLGWVFIRPATGSLHAQQLGWTRADEVEIGYRYRRAAWGRGIATEAALPLLDIALADEATTAIVACAATGNARSLRVLEKLGLDRVGEVMLPDAQKPTVKLTRLKRAGNERVAPGSWE